MTGAELRVLVLDGVVPSHGYQERLLGALMIPLGVQQTGERLGMKSVPHDKEKPSPRKSLTS